MKTLYCFICLIITSYPLFAATLEVGNGKTYARLQAAAAVAKAGDTILIREGIYSGGDYIENLKGTADALIYIRAAEGETVIFRGNTQAFHLTDPAYLHISGLIFEQQTGNGVNIDDGGSYDTPAHNIWIENCEWRGMNATGNNDELKMSGVDNFQILKCIFRNGATGGSLVDMVGCHKGGFEENIFENGGSNSIQAKGGTSDITIYRNKFVNGGERALNIGGSTGLEFFRPIDVKYEASQIRVYSNIFVGSTSPIAFVGSILCEVRGNTIYKPGRWAIRILQETVGNGFEPCGKSDFSDNLIVHNSPQPAINIGANTAPETFTFTFNLWYNPDNSSWQGPNAPATMDPAILIADPKFVDTVGFHLLATSPAKGSGSGSADLFYDYYGRQFAPYNGSGGNRCRGAVEYYPLTAITDFDKKNEFSIFPNPADNIVHVLRRKYGEKPITNAECVEVISGMRFHLLFTQFGSITQFDTHSLYQGMYSIIVNGENVGTITVVR